ncbi:MAG: deoxyribose-phosphate aldolase [Deltaproteobacteria bacterium]|nr:deoxyribose-phosphate aldolase [Deltaproteobacteria bacterium]
MRTDIERLVEAVAQRVQLRLVDELRSTPCTATAEQCEGDGLCAARRAGDVEAIRQAGASRVGASPGVGSVRPDLAGMIDHTLLRPDTSRDDLRALCEDARQYSFASVCVNSANVSFCKRLLGGSGVMTVAVVGFPLGAASCESKAFETRQAIRDGADEIDMVLNIGALKSCDYRLVFEDIASVVKAAGRHAVKVILETVALERDEKVVACALSKAAGAAFVKTSTGFGGGGATLEDVRLMRQIVGDDIGVKASGGVHNAAEADAMVAAGATRIGASASVAIVTGKQSDSNY